MKSRMTVPIMLAMAVGLTACNQANNTDTPATAASTTASTPMSHEEHMQAMATASASNMQASTSQPPHIMAYMDSMDKMHQAMSAGVQAKNADVGFAKGMIPHHEGAIDMATIELHYGKETEMKALAQKIIDAQQGEIKFMQQWLTDNEAKQPTAANASAVTNAYQQKDMANHDAMMQGTMDADPDVAFAKGMIPHHQGAIDMANVEEQYGKNAEMLKLAGQIKQAQTPEIKQMQDWLAKKGVK